MTHDRNVLAPQGWEDFVGQAHLKRTLDVHIKAALKNERPLHHVFLTGPPGMGKSTIAHIIGQRLGDPVTEIKMPLQERALYRLLRRFEGGILFLDEIHALPRKLQEVLLTVVSKDGGYVQDNRGRITYLPWLTVVAATTERDKVLPPLISRFPVRPEFENYSDEEMARIVHAMAAKLKLRINNDTAKALGRAAGGIPRNAERLILAASDLALEGTVTAPKVLDFCRTDPDGLEVLHQRYLAQLDSLGGNAGQQILGSVLQLPQSTLREVERLLAQRGYIEFAPTGRELTPAGMRRVRGEGEARVRVRR